MNTKSNQIIRHGLWLAVLLFGFLSVGQEADSQTKDTLWTRDVWPLYVINGVFSPDDKFIYATGASDSYGKDPFTVLKYDLQGNLLTKIDSIGGIKQFSEDGRFFWNYYGDKYDAITFEKLFTFGAGGNKISNWMWSISEQNDIGVVVTNDGKFIDSQFRTYYYDNFKIFKPSTSKVIMDTAYPGNIFTFIGVSIKPNSNEVAFLIQSIARDYKGNEYTDTSRIEIWDLKNFKKLREVEIQEPKNFGDGLLIKYSPDGSVLGYQHDSKLTLYSTVDYSIIWESGNSPFLIILNFTWSKDNKNMFISFYSDLDFMGLCKLNNKNKSIEKTYKPSSGTTFINFNSGLTRILTNLSDSLELLYYDPVSVKDDYLHKFEINLTQNQNSNEVSLKIDAKESSVCNYTITNILGDVLQSSIPININEGYNQIAISTVDFPTGIYFLSLTISGRTHTLKFAIVR